jgi:hypothetical protein
MQREGVRARTKATRRMNQTGKRSARAQQQPAAHKAAETDQTRAVEPSRRIFVRTSTSRVPVVPVLALTITSALVPLGTVLWSHVDASSPARGFEMQQL